MTKDTLIKLIDTLKLYNDDEHNTAKLSELINRKPEMLNNIKEDELPEIKEHLAELQKSINQNENKKIRKYKVKTTEWNNNFHSVVLYYSTNSK